MFYMFHHIPKCAGTSFREFLRSILNLVDDNLGFNPALDPNGLSRFRASPLDLQRLTSSDCLTGHYNVSGIFMWERYPGIESIPHRKFSILRDPFEAALSGVRYSVKQGWEPPKLDQRDWRESVIRRMNYFSRVLGVARPDDIPAVLDKYWFVAPLDRIEHAKRILEGEVGRRGKDISVLNQTERSDGIFVSDLRDEFRERSALDYELYDAAVLRFGRFAFDTLATPQRH